MGLDEGVGVMSTDLFGAIVVEEGGGTRHPSRVRRVAEGECGGGGGWRRWRQGIRRTEEVEAAKQKRVRTGELICYKIKCILNVAIIRKSKYLLRF